VKLDIAHMKALYSNFPTFKFFRVKTPNPLTRSTRVEIIRRACKIISVAQKNLAVASVRFIEKKRRFS